jgi:hypothetical protein
MSFKRIMMNRLQMFKKLRIVKLLILLMKRMLRSKRRRRK